MLTSIDAAIARILAGEFIVEWNEGPVRVKKSDPMDLLKTLQGMRDYYSAAASTDRSAARATFTGKF